MKKLLLLSLLFLTACSMAVEKPTVKIKDVRFAGVDAKGVSLDFLLDVTNPNSFDLPLHGYTYDLSLMAVPFVRGESKESQTLYGKASTDMLIPVRISYADVLKIIRRNPGLKELPYQLNADLSLGTLFGNIAVPVRTGGTVTIPKQYQSGSLLRQFGDLLNNLDR
jgi:LEA14-like dessication related protein